jgi:photosynthetic reaction center cytochrome c subunit
MRTTLFAKHKALPLAAVGIALLMAGCEGPPPQSTQLGYRGVGQNAFVNPRILAAKQEANIAPESLAPAVPIPVAAGSVYQNLQVLGDVSITEFTRQMSAFAEWIVPQDQWVNGQGCIYCHDLNNMAADTKYQKVVARAMIKMTKRANVDWQAHVAPTGVTCYTCHRGNPIPKYVWTTNPGEKPHTSGYVGNQNRLSPVVAFTSLPYDPLTTYFDKEAVIALTPPTAVAPFHPKTVNTKNAEGTYALMAYISKSLGVGCNHCHNSRQFADWAQSSPARVKGWYAIRMVREANKNFILPLTDIIPAANKGPLGDPKRVACETCHQGVNKPLFGAAMAKDYPALLTPPGAAPAPAAAEPAPAAAAPAPAQAGGEAAPASEPKVTGLAGTAAGVM